MKKLLFAGMTAIFCMNLSAASATDLLTKVNLKATEHSAPFSKRPSEKMRTAWVCETANYTCYPSRTPNGIGDPCKCCSDDDCEWGTILDYSSIDSPTQTVGLSN